MIFENSEISQARRNTFNQILTDVYRQKHLEDLTVTKLRPAFDPVRNQAMECLDSSGLEEFSESLALVGHDRSRI